MQWGTAPWAPFLHSHSHTEGKLKNSHLKIQASKSTLTLKETPNPNLHELKHGKHTKERQKFKKCVLSLCQFDGISFLCPHGYWEPIQRVNPSKTKHSSHQGLLVSGKFYDKKCHSQRKEENFKCTPKAAVMFAIICWLLRSKHRFVPQKQLMAEEAAKPPQWKAQIKRAATSFRLCHRAQRNCTEN